MSNPDKAILLMDPNGVAFEVPWQLDYAHPHAITFCILEDGEKRCLLIHRQRPHLYIYNALKACDPAGDIASWKVVFEEYGVEKVCGRLTRIMVEKFQKLSQKEHGFPRYKVPSGRLWYRLKSPHGGYFHVMMMWDGKLIGADGPTAWVAQKMRARGPVYLGAPGNKAAWQILVS